MKFELDRSPPALVLIAQPNRSGGTLMAQLLDGHPELHSHPPELKFPADWPVIDLSKSSRHWFVAVWEAPLKRHAGRGYLKDRPAAKMDLGREAEHFAFDYARQAHFKGFLRRRPEPSRRAVLDAYFASLFDAWRNYANRPGEKRWIVGQRGRLRFRLDEFFADYPDGRHITIVREPKAWIASSVRYSGMHPEGLRHMAEEWRNAVLMQLDAKERYGDRVFLVTYAQIVDETEATMRRLADWLGIAFDPCLLAPTFNRQPIGPNSSFVAPGSGVLTAMQENWRQVLSDGEAAEVWETAGAIYEMACVAAD